MRVAITGTTGRVGKALADGLADRHHIVPLPRSVLDLADPSSLACCLESLDCDLIINPAGITGLESCEDDPALATCVNAEAPGQLANWAASRGIRLIHFSTDYVLGGDKPGLRSESDIPDPLSHYASSKLAGEHAVLRHPDNLVLRVSWVFGPEKPSFVDQVFEAAVAGRPIAAIADKFSLPTSTSDLTEWVNLLINQRTTGLIHACNSGDPASWHDLATAVLREMHAAGIIDDCPEVAEQTLAEIPFFRAIRPRHTAMDNTRLRDILGRSPRIWSKALAEYVRSR